MVDFETQMKAAFDGPILDTFGAAIIYTPAGGEAVNCNADVTEDDRNENEDIDGKGRLERLVISISSSDVGTVTPGDALTYDSRTFRVEQVEELAGIWQVTVMRFVATEKSAEDYRRRRE